jgi:hypothetical protein
MKITTLNNQELIIQALNEDDFKAAQNVAKMIVKDFHKMADICGECEHELWVHICFIDMPYNAKEIRDTYNTIKAAL